jgi:hypothetical protein
MCNFLSDFTCSANEPPKLSPNVVILPSLYLFLTSDIHFSEFFKRCVLDPKPNNTAPSFNISDAFLVPVKTIFKFLY